MSTLDIIEPIIVKTYGKGAVSVALAEHLANKIDTFQSRQFGPETREDMIRETCWNWMTGGSTAERAAGKIEIALKASR
jgi:hypothetical protein